MAAKSNIVKPYIFFCLHFIMFSLGFWNSVSFLRVLKLSVIVVFVLDCYNDLVYLVKSVNVIIRM